VRGSTVEVGRWEVFSTGVLIGLGVTASAALATEFETDALMRSNTRAYLLMTLSIADCGLRIADCSPHHPSTIRWIDQIFIDAGLRINDGELSIASWSIRNPIRRMSPTAIRLGALAARNCFGFGIERQ
jgi:hypothetical protein